MNRTEAVIFLQEVLMFFSGASIQSFGLIDPNKADPVPGGFKIFFKGTLNDESRRNILSLVQNHDLQFKEEDGIVIYDA